MRELGGIAGGKTVVSMSSIREESTFSLKSRNIRYFRYNLSGTSYEENETMGQSIINKDGEMVPLV